MLMNIKCHDCKLMQIILLNIFVWLDNIMSTKIATWIYINIITNSQEDSYCVYVSMNTNIIIANYIVK